MHSFSLGHFGQRHCTQVHKLHNMAPILVNPCLQLTSYMNRLYESHQLENLERKKGRKKMNERKYRLKNQPMININVIFSENCIFGEIQY